MSAPENVPSPPIWDAHVHGYPGEVAADSQAWADMRGEPHWAQLVTCGPQGWADVDELLRAMDRDGIERVLLQGWYWQQPETAREQNRWYARWVARHPDRLMAFAAVHPGWADIAGELAAARDWGACGVGECLPQVQSAAGWADPGWQAILEWTSANTWPICLHVTEPVGHDYPGRVPTPLDELVAVIEAHPSQRWILAHWGGGLPFYSMNRRVRALLDRVWFDTAASPLLYDARVWAQVAALVGPQRILFGSDFPLRLYPARQRKPGWRELLEELAASGLSAVERAAIGSGNLQQLLQLSR